MQLKSEKVRLSNGVFEKNAVLRKVIMLDREEELSSGRISSTAEFRIVRIKNTVLSKALSKRS